MDVELSSTLIDCGLSKKGIDQCSIAAQFVSQINFEQVHVSPMRQALESAYHLFKDHKNFEKIRFIVSPLLREKVMVAADLPSFDSATVIEKEYATLWEERGGTLEYNKEALSPPGGDEPWKPWYFDSFDEDF